jgi:acyl carrier protein
MNTQEYLKRVEEIFAVKQKGVLTAATEIEAIGIMDSMAVLELQACADEQFGIVLEPRDITACKTVGDLCQLVKLSAG